MQPHDYLCKMNIETITRKDRAILDVIALLREIADSTLTPRVPNNIRIKACKRLNEYRIASEIGMPKSTILKGGID